ncbi:MAG: phosphodiester glycosidase family protein [Verrucomicrobiales bacterium]|nr:phosphodiester glycosidase family protein [Verrucomicrobiales bacterium]
MNNNNGNNSLPRWATIAFVLACLAAGLGVVLVATKRRPVPEAALEAAGGIRYEQYREASELWSVHVVRVPRRNGAYELTSRHAAGRAIGLTPVTAQLALTNTTGTPVAAINGDYYQRQGPYAGDPRGLQIVDGELLSAPDGGPAIWIDRDGEPHAGIVQSELQVTWPDGSSTSLGWNESRPADRVTLYTPAIGPSTRTRDGREFVLDLLDAPDGALPGPGRTYRARVREVRDTGNTPVPADAVVLSVGPGAAGKMPPLAPESELIFSTATVPNLEGARTAISGGPLLVRNGRRLRIEVPDSQSYEFSSMKERHPRAAIGWDDADFLLVTVDGRQLGVAEGMTLEELAAYLVRLGCREAMNLDGGGSSTLWFDGKIRNFLCDGYERDVANSLVICRKSGSPSQPAETPTP